MSEGRIVGKYRILGTLGSGAQGKCVYYPFVPVLHMLGICTLMSFQFDCLFFRVKKAQKQDGSIVALKLIEKSTLNASSFAKLRREIKIMMACKHRHIVGYFGCDSDYKYTKRDGTVIPCILMELEYAAGEELFSYLSLAGSFPEDIARIYFQQAINGLQ